MTLLNELAGRTNEGWISKFISFGNACDVDELDALKYYATEPTIQQIWSYLEGFHNGPAFINAVKEATQKKPVLLMKANRGAAGAKASASHSASLAANDAVCDQLLKNVGLCSFCSIVGGRDSLRRVEGHAEHRHDHPQPAAPAGPPCGQWLACVLLEA